MTVINLISENTIEHRMLDTLAMKQTVAASVLDKPGEVKEIKLRSGRQAMVERLEQLVTPCAPPSAGTDRNPQVPDPKSAATDDAALRFARFAAERVNGALVRCEERYPQSGSHSVLLVVVDRDAALWCETLKSTYRDLFDSRKTDPLAPVQLEVIDRATDEAIQRLTGAGLISKTTRATRPLFPSADNAEAAPLAAEELARSKAHRERAARKLKMTQVLGDTGFGDEARAALIEAIHALGSALAVEHRLPEPVEAKDGLQPSLSHGWAGALPVLKAFIHDPAAIWKPVAERLASLMATPK